jgi:hypothetical protein
MAKESKNHHYVPQCLLKNFSIRGKGKQVYVFDKSSNKIFASAIKNAGSENEFNVLEVDGVKVNFEEIFQTIDTLTARTLKKIINAENLSVLSEEEIGNLAEIAATQLLRTKLQRTSILDLSEQLRNVIQRAGFNQNEVFGSDVFSENNTKLILIRRLYELDKLITQFVEKTILLLKTSKSKPFWISDNPIVLYNPFPYGELGLSSKGVKIYFPVSKTLCVAFYCPSIMLKIRKDRERFLQPSNNKHTLSLRDYAGYVYPEVLDTDSTTVELINQLQVYSSSRFLYSSTDNFSLAQSLVDKLPQLRNVKGRFQIGEMGKALPANNRLPRGDFLVVFGAQDHHILPIKYIDNEEKDSGISFFSTDFEKLRIIHEDSPFEEATVYCDGQGIIRMSEAEFEEVDYTGKHPIKIKHTDDGLNQLFKLHR